MVQKNCLNPARAGADHSEWAKYGDASANIPKRLQELIQLIISSNETNTFNMDKILSNLKIIYEIAKGQADYVETSGIAESPLQTLIKEDTKKDEVTSKGLCMLSSPYQANLLTFLAEITKAKDILEIGMFTGYGTVTLAESLNCETVTALDIDPYCESFLKERIEGTPLKSKIHVLTGPAGDSLELLKTEEKKFDLVFMDANKDGYLDYYKFIMDNKMLRNNEGLIACDNVLWSATTFNQSTSNGKILHDFVEFVKEDERVNQMILPVRDGILLIMPKKEALKE